jgi:hypothetical protein
MNIGGNSNFGITVEGYGSGEGLTKSTDNNPIVGYIEPTDNLPSWIAWFTKKGDLDIYTKREANGAVVGEPIRVFHDGRVIIPDVVERVIPGLPA